MTSPFETHILVLAAHPDDGELGCAGTLIQAVRQGKSVVMTDLTQGEMGTRGTPETRRVEGAEAARIIGAKARVVLDLPDGMVLDTPENRLKVIAVIRRFRPEIVITNARTDRHPDHGNAHNLEEAACFLAGLAKIRTEFEGKEQVPIRPRLVLNYLQDRWMRPDIVVDITDAWEQKMEAIMAYKSQFYDPASKEPATYISSQVFLDGIKSRAMEMGRMIERPLGEGFTSSKVLGVSSVSELI